MTSKQETKHYEFMSWCIENEVSPEAIELNEETGNYEGLAETGGMIEFPEIYQDIVNA